MESKSSAPHEGLFDEPLGQPRKELQGWEFRYSARLLRSKRDVSDWTGAFIVGVHRELFGKRFPSAAGRMRTSEILFGDRGGASPETIDSLLGQLALQMRDDLTEARRLSQQPELGAFLEHVFLTAAKTHGEMLRIHPFLDGNGRWARVVTNTYLRDAGLPYSTIFFTKDKKDYISALNRCMDHGEPGDLASIIAGGFLLEAEARMKHMSGLLRDVGEPTKDWKEIVATRVMTRKRVKIL